MLFLLDFIAVWILFISFILLCVKSVKVSALQSCTITFQIQTFISSVMWLRNEFNHSIVLYLYFSKKKIFQKYIFYYNKVKSFIFEAFEMIQGAYSLKIALMQSFGLYIWWLIMLPLKTNNLEKPSIQLNLLIFILFVT